MVQRGVLLEQKNCFVRRIRTVRSCEPRCSVSKKHKDGACQLHPRTDSVVIRSKGSYSPDKLLLLLLPLYNRPPSTSKSQEISGLRRLASVNL